MIEPHQLQVISPKIRCVQRDGKIVEIYATSHVQLFQQIKAGSRVEFIDGDRVYGVISGKGDDCEIPL